jgi:hypothetical protein
MPNIRKTLIVGLGGTGALAVQSVKKTLLQFYGVIPHAVKTIVLDTDNRLPEPKRVYDKEGRLILVKIEPSEFLYLPVEHPENVKETKSIKRWWPEGIPTRAIFSGAGAYRAFGRLAFHAHVKEIGDTLKNLVSQIEGVGLGLSMQQEQNLALVETQGVDIYIIGSLAGGTGSGCFIDTGFLCRSVLPGTNHKIVGFLILPWIFKNIPATDRRDINGYAALRELDHYMDFDYNKGQPVFVFGNKEYSASRSPFDVANLIDGKNENGIHLDGSGDWRGVTNLCEIIGMGIALNIGDVGRKNLSTLDNLKMLIGQCKSSDWGGKFPYYSTFGISALIYPWEKHFNLLYSHFVFSLINEIQSSIKDSELSAVSEGDLENDFSQYLTENRLDETNKAIINDLINPDQIDTRITWVEGLESSESLGDWANENWDNIQESISGELERNVPQKIKETKEALEQGLQEREKEYGPGYSLRFGEKILARFARQIEVEEDNFWSMRSREIDELDSEISNCSEDIDNYFGGEVVEASGWRGKLLRKWSKVGNEYLNMLSDKARKQMDLKRKREALKVYESLANVIREYEEGMNLKEIERKLSQARRLVETEIIGTTVLKEVFPIHTVTVFPKEILTKTKEGKTEKRLFKGTSEDFQSIGCPVDVQEFLKNTGLSFEKISKMTPKALKEVMVTHAKEKLSTLHELTIEEILLEDAEADEDKWEEFLKWLGEASKRSVPFWKHGAEGTMASLMKEIFFIGIGDQSKSGFTQMDYPDAKSKPQFVSTGDDHKIFYFKYKAPLPAYLLEDMGSSRKEYLAMPQIYTPHAEKDMELNSSDLFPVTKMDRRINRVLLLALSNSLIKEENLEETLYYLDEPKCLEPGEERVELGKALWSTYEELRGKHREALLGKLGSIVAEEIKSNPQITVSNLEKYYKMIKKAFDERKGEISIGDVMVLFEQIKILDEFFRGKGDIQNFLQS